MKKILQLLAGLFLLISTARTQPYYFRHYQVENGLSHNTVFCTVQDKNGFLWIGTKDGLNRFDGYRFKTFTITKDDKGRLGMDLILSLAIDEKGTLWAGTQIGLFYFDALKERFIPFLDTLHGINDIFFDRWGQLWYIADYTLCHYNYRTKKLTTFASEHFFNATSLCETDDGTMWISTADGDLKQYNPVTQSFKSYHVFSHSPPTESKVIQKIVYNKKGSILIGTSNQGIKEFNLGQHDYKDVFMYNPDKTTIYVRDILQVSDEETWFATESGIYILNHHTGKYVNLKKKTLDPYSLSDNAVYTLYKDVEGGIWAGTFFGGLNYFPKPYATFQKYFPDYSKNSISGNAVREICEDNTGIIWIGTEDAGLNSLDPKTGIVKHFGPTGKSGSISYYNIHGLLVTDNELWIGTFEHGLNIMDLNTGKIKKHYVAGAGVHALKNNFIVSLLKTKKGEIYIGTALGIYQYNRKNDDFIYLKDIADGSFIACMQEDQQGTIWVATHNRGLYFINPRTNAKGHFESDPGNKNSLSANSINSIYEDSKGSLWLATERGGLCRLDQSRKNFTCYNTQNGLPSNFVFKVLEDHQKTLWITTSKGLAHLNPSNGRIKVYTKANGLINDQFNYNSGYSDKEGNLYFGSVQGMIKFNPGNIHKDEYVPTVHITGFQVQNKEVEISQDSSILNKSLLYTDKIILPYDQSSFSIDFAALRFASPETTVYSYIMEGLDKEWTYLPTNRKVYFTNLKPGTYLFKVKAGNSEVWNSAKKLTIIIKPPIWRTPEAYVLYGLMIISLAYYLIRTYHDIQENKKEKEIYRAKMEFFTNIAHEIKTPLTLIKGPIENLSEMTISLPQIQEDVRTMERNTDRLVNLINQILDFRQTETKGFSLDFSEVNITEIAKEAFMTFQPLAKKRSLSYTLKQPASPIHIMADAEALTKIFDNLISNAVKYAQHEVIIKVQPPQKGINKLSIEISNDGFIIPTEMKEKIFEPFFRIKDTNKQKGTGLGLALVRSLVELHNGKVFIKAHEGNCNVFVVELPYHGIQKGIRV